MAPAQDQGTPHSVFAATTGLIFPGPTPESRAYAPAEPAQTGVSSAPPTSSAPQVQYTHSSQFQQQVELYRGRYYCCNGRGALLSCSPVLPVALQEDSPQSCPQSKDKPASILQAELCRTSLCTAAASTLLGMLASVPTQLCIRAAAALMTTNAGFI